MLRSAVVRRAAAACAAAGLVIGLAACSPGPAVDVELPEQVEGALPAEISGQLQAAVENAMTATGSTGAIVGVWAPWSGSWVEAFGTTGPDGAPVTTDMTFKAGAVTRTMTCDVLYGLAADGVVDLGDSISDWVNGHGDLSEITLEQLCDSTTGLGTYAGRVEGRWLANPGRVWNPRELVSYGLAGSPAAEPGATYLDSDTGYVLLGLALERASGKTMPELYEAYIAEPLDLVATTLPATSTATLPGWRSADLAEGGVECIATVELTDLSPSAGSTAAGVVTDVTELGHYIQSVALQARSYDVEGRLADPLPAYDKAPAWYTATGGTFQAGSLVGQYGAIPGYLTAAFADRETGMTVVAVLNNSRAGSGVAAYLAWQLAAIASKAPAAAGQTAPEAGLPWTPEQYGDAVTAASICPAA